MKRPSIILAIAAAICLMANALPLRAQHELECFINDPDEAGMTNIRATPGGKVLFQVDGQGGYDLTVIVQQGGWWRIKDPVEVFGDDMKDPKAEADARPDYIFDPVKKTLSIFNTVYFRK